MIFFPHFHIFLLAVEKMHVKIERDGNGRVFLLTKVTVDFRYLVEGRRQKLARKLFTSKSEQIKNVESFKQQPIKNEKNENKHVPGNFEFVTFVLKKMVSDVRRKLSNVARVWYLDG
uniref:Uncharacterized protein n=1 Tax=Cacopsylla melanoneura TaxID=428564 RepID=A0A8D8TQV9_9HEMI